MYNKLNSAFMSVDVTVENAYNGCVNFIVVYEGAKGTTVSSPTIVPGKSTGTFAGVNTLDGVVTVIVRYGEEDCTDRIVFNKTFAGQDQVHVKISSTGVVSVVLAGVVLTGLAVGMGFLLYYALRSPPSAQGEGGGSGSAPAPPALPTSRFAT